MLARFRIGIDLDGTKIEGAAVDASGSVRVRRRVPTPIEDYQATVDAIVALVGGIEQEIGVTASVGIGIPGSVSPITGLVKNANSTWLIGHPLQRDLEIALGRPTRLANDANCFALSEATDGAAAAMETVFGVILGTGVGGGIAIRGRILVGANAIGGRMGPQSAAVPGTRRNPRTALLLRPVGLSRDLSFRAGTSGRSSSPFRTKSERTRNRAGG